MIAERSEHARLRDAIALFVLSFALLAPGLGRLVPYDLEPDNYVAVQVDELEARVPPLERTVKYRSYPLLLANLARALPKVATPANDDLAGHLRAAGDVTLRVRWVVMLLACLAAPATYLLARRFLARGAALGAGALVATSLLLQIFATQARPHGAHLAAGVLATLAALRVLERPTWTRYLVAGLACALASSVLQTGFFALVPLLAAHSFVPRDERRIAKLGGALACVAVAFVAFLPDGPSTPQDSGLDASGWRAGSHSFHFARIRAGGFASFVAETWFHDPALLVLAACGLSIALPAAKRWNADPATCVVASYGIAYLGTWGLYDATHDRYWLPLVPSLAMLAAAFVERVATWIARGELARARVRLALWLLVLAPSAWASIALVRLRTTPDTIELATRWIDEHLDPSTTALAVTPQLNLPLWYDDASIARGGVPKLAAAWIRHQASLAPAQRGARRWKLANVPPELAGSDSPLGHALFEAWSAALAPTHLVYERTNWNRDLPMTRALHRDAEQHGELLYATPDLGDGFANRRTDAYQRVRGCFRRVLTLDRLGPPIEVWSLGARASVGLAPAAPASSER